MDGVDSKLVPWSTIAADPDVQKLPAADYDAVRRDYFDRVIAPNLATDEIPDVWTDFDSRTARGLLGDVKAGAKRFGLMSQPTPLEPPASGSFDAAPTPPPNIPAASTVPQVGPDGHMTANVPPAVQAQRDGQRMTLLQQELQADPNNAALQREIAFEQAKAPAFDKEFNTTLSQPEEAQFQQWKAQNAPNDSGADYDLRGAYKAGLSPSPENGHWPDTYKKPNHPTFSDQSKYANYGQPGSWQGDTFIPHPSKHPEASAIDGMIGQAEKDAAKFAPDLVADTVDVVSKHMTPEEEAAFDAANSQPFDEFDMLRRDAASGTPTEPSEFSKGVSTGFIGAKQMGTAAATIPALGAIKTLAAESAAYDAIDQGQAPPDGSGHVEQRARMYANSDPETRAKLKDLAVKRIAEHKEVKDTLIAAWGKYQEEMKATQGKVPNFTDIKGANDFVDWFNFNIGQGLPYLGVSALAGLLAGVPGVVASGYAMGVGDIQSGNIEKGVPDNAGAALVGAVPYAALEMLGPVGRAFRGVPKETLERVATSYFKRAGKEVPANAIEEFINEAGQEAIKDAGVAVGTGGKVVTADNLVNWFNAGMAGAAMGGAAGTVSAIPSHGAKPAEEKPKVEPELRTEPDVRAGMEPKVTLPEKERIEGGRRKTEPKLDAATIPPDTSSDGPTLGNLPSVAEHRVPAAAGTTRAPEGDESSGGATAGSQDGAVAASAAGSKRWQDAGVSPPAAVQSEVTPKGLPGAVTPLEKPVPRETVDAAAHEAALSPENSLPEPTAAQKVAGNYIKGHVTVNGLDISIENPAGSERSGTDASGKPWSVEMASHYGYLKGTIGKDKDHVDIFVKQDTPTDYNGPVFVVDQKKANGQLDEHKVMLGFSDEAAARAGYLENYAKGWDGIRAITPMSMPQFKDWLAHSDTTKPAAEADPLLPESKVGGAPISAVSDKMLADAAKKDGTAGEAAKLEQANRKRATPLLDERLKNADVVAELQRMPSEAGWAEVGGKLIREQGNEGQVTGRTSWIPKAEWFKGGLGNEKVIGEAVRKAVAGEPLRAAEKRVVIHMLDYLSNSERGQFAKFDTNVLNDAGVLDNEPGESDVLNKYLTVARAKLGNDAVESTLERIGIEYEGKPQSEYETAVRSAVDEQLGKQVRPGEGRAGVRATAPGSESQNSPPGGDAGAARATEAGSGQPKEQVQSGEGRQSLNQSTPAQTPEKSGVSSSATPASNFSAEGSDLPREASGAQAAAGKEVSRFAGMYGKGMTVFNARLQQKRLATANPTVDYRVEASPEFGPDRHVVVGYEKPAKPERRTDTATRKRVGDMSIEEARTALLTDPLTGLPNRRAFDEAPQKARKASIDLDGLKGVNDYMGHEAGDQLLRSAGLAFQEVGEGIWHVSGDEFIAMHDDDAVLHDWMARAAKLMETMVVQVKRPDGTLITKTGIGFSYGIGDNLAQADQNLQVNKSDREAAGLRPSRGERPGGVVESPTQGQPDRQRPALDLTAQSPAELKAAEVEKQRAAEAQRTREAAPAANEFSLTGSDRPTDVAAAAGQMELAPAKRASEMSAADHLRAAAAKMDEAAKPAITDVGEKIGGARKDVSAPTGAAKQKSESEDPGWRKRYAVSQIEKSRKPEEDGRWVVRDTRSKDYLGQARQVGRETYATKEEAEAIIPLVAVSRNHSVGMRSGKEPAKYYIYRSVTDRKRVQVVDQEFDSRVDALRYMADHAVDIIETKTSFGEEILPRPDKVQRTGVEHRKGDVQGEDFMRTFGFRGVEFGNWEAQDERQTVMNHAYDALMDLAGVIGIPERAIGMDGELALAFGARGQGLAGARAHYELDYGVINLTKMKGAGSLAHEWFHALDHYFGRQDGKTSKEKVANPRGDKVFKNAGDPARDMVSHGFGRESAVRPELREAYTALIETMYRKAEQFVEDTQRADRFVGETREEVRRTLEALRKELAEQKDPQYWKRNNKPASAAQLAEFDGLTDKIIQGEFLETTSRRNEKSRGFGSYRQSNDALDQISAIYKAVRGRSGFDSTHHQGVMDRISGTMRLYGARLKMLADANTGTEKTRKVPTSFLMEAKSIDQGRASEYWATPHEMAARAFQAYVEDKVSERGNRSDFLTYGTTGAIPTPWGWKRPFPEGAERDAINTAFDKFVAVLETKETDKGIALMRRGEATGLPLEEAKAHIDAITGKLQNAGRVETLRSVDDLPKKWRGWVASKGATEQLRGLYVPETDTTYIISNQHGSIGELEFTVFHELFGHRGFQGVLGSDFKPAMRSLYLKNANVRATAKKIMAQYGYDQITATEEALSDLAGAGKFEQGLLRQILAAMQTALRKIGMTKVADFLEGLTDAEVGQLLADAKRFVTDGPHAYTRDMQPAMHRAFHGSPHEFDQFSTEHIDSGEGAQAYGWGLYFAGRKEVAEHYRESTSRYPTVSIDGKPLERDMNFSGDAKTEYIRFAHGRLVDRLLRGATLKDLQRQAALLAAEARRNAGLGNDPAYVAQETAISERLDEIHAAAVAGRVTIARGKLYQVQLAPKESEYLDWDKPLSQQSADVKVSLKNALDDIVNRETDYHKASQLSRDYEHYFDDHADLGEFAGQKITGMPVTGAELYKQLAKQLGGDRMLGPSDKQYGPVRYSDDEAASKALSDAGIPGIKYLDHNSRRMSDADLKNAIIETKRDIEYAEKMGGMEAQLADLRDRLDRYDDQLKNPQAHNYVIFDDKHIKVEARMSRKGQGENPKHFASHADLSRSLRYKLGDFVKSDRVFNRWWHTTVGSQYHKAQQSAPFKVVFDAVQDVIGDTSSLAVDAENQAPTLLPRIDKISDLRKKAPSNSELRPVAEALYEGTLYGGGGPMNGRVWTDAELRGQETLGNPLPVKFNLTDRQIKLYREARAATETAVDEMAKSAIFRQARAIGLEPERESFRDVSLPDVVAQAQSYADQMKSDLAVELEIRKDNAQDELANEPDPKKRETLQASHDSSIAETQTRIDSLESFSKAIGDIGDKAAGLRKGGYFPLMRFGEYEVRAVGPKGDTLFYGMYESQAAANRAKRVAQAEFSHASVKTGIKDLGAYRLFKGVSPDVLDLFAEHLGVDQNAAFQQYLHDVVASRSAMKRMIHREGTAGFSADSRRSLATLITSSARLAATNYHGWRMLDGYSRIPEGQGDVQTEARKLIEYIQDPKEEAAFARGLMFTWFIGGSAASAIVNLTQPAMVSAPWLAKYTSYKDAVAKLAGKSPKSESYLHDFNRAVKDGLVAPQEIYNLMAETRDRGLLNNPLLRKFSTAWGAFFSVAEQMNRAMTFKAAWQIAKADSKLGNPYDFSKRAVQETQFVYNKGSRPNWARGPIGAVLFTFKMFTIQYLELAQRLYKTDKGAFALLMLTLFLAAGLEGLPFAEDIEDLIDTIGQWLGYGTNSKKKLRQLTENWLGKAGSSVLRNGLSSLTPIDLSGRLGMHNLIPGTALFKQSETDKARDVLEFLGPSGKLVQSGMASIDRAIHGDLWNPQHGALRFLAPTSIQNRLQGFGMLTKDQYNDPKGRKVTETGPIDALAKMMGFQPSKVAEVQERVRETEQDIRLQRQKESEITDLWSEGMNEKDPDKTKRARQEMDDWNKRNPDLRIVVTPQQILHRVMDMRRSREQRAVQSAPREMKGNVMKDLRP